MCNRRLKIKSHPLIEDSKGSPSKEGLRKFQQQQQQQQKLFIFLLLYFMNAGCRLGFTKITKLNKASLISGKPKQNMGQNNGKKITL